jgi:hypothetical protein
LTQGVFYFRSVIVSLSLQYIGEEQICRVRILPHSSVAKASALLIVFFGQSVIAQGQNTLFTLTSLHKMLNSKRADVRRMLDSAGYSPIAVDGAGKGSPSPIYGGTSGWRDADGRQVMFEYCDPSYTACIGFEIDAKSAIVVLVAYSISPPDSVAEKINYRAVPKKRGAFCVLTIYKSDEFTQTTFSRKGYGFFRILPCLTKRKNEMDRPITH